MNNEDEGMIGKILHAARINHQEISNRFDQIKTRSDENQIEITDTRSNIEEIQAKEKELATQEESKDDTFSNKTLMSRETDFCVAYYQEEYKDLREKIIKQVFKDMS